MNQDFSTNISFCPYIQQNQLVKGVTLTKSVSCYGTNQQLSQSKIVSNSKNISHKKQSIQKLLLDSSQSGEDALLEQDKLSYQLSQGSSIEKSFASPKNQKISKSISFLGNNESKQNLMKSSIIKQNKKKQNQFSKISSKYIYSTRGGHQQLNNSLSRKVIQSNQQKRQKAIQHQTKKKVSKQWDTILSFDQTLLKSHSLGVLDRCQTIQQKIKGILALEQYCRIKHSIQDVSQCMDQILIIVADVEKQRIFLQKKLDIYQQSNMELMSTLEYLKNEVNSLSKEVQVHKQSARLYKTSSKKRRNYFSDQVRYKNEQTPIRYLSQLLPQRKFSHSMKQINILRVSQEEDQLYNQINAQYLVEFIYALKEKLNGKTEQTEQIQIIGPKLRNKIIKTQELNSWLKEVQQKIHCLVNQKEKIENSYVRQHFISSQFQTQFDSLKVLDDFIDFSNSKFKLLESNFQKMTQKLDFQKQSSYALKYFNQIMLSVIIFSGIFVNTFLPDNKNQKLFIKKHIQINRKNQKKQKEFSNKGKLKRFNIFLNLLQENQKSCYNSNPQNLKIQECFEIGKAFIQDLKRLIVLLS